MNKKNNYVAKYGRNINNVIVHCTGGALDSSVQAIVNFWKKPKSQGGRGWKHVGYHKLIPMNGNTAILATPHQVTNGVYGWNSDAYHISWTGGMNGDNRTQAQKDSLYREVKWAIDEFGPNIDIWGHRDFSKDKDGNGIITPGEWSKQCPAFDLIQWMNKTGLYNYLLNKK